MKKVLLLLALVLSSVGAWAQTATLQASTNKINPEHVYWIMNGNNCLMDSETYYYDLGANEKPGRFAFVAVSGTENDYKMYSIDANKWVSYNNSSISVSAANQAVLVDDEESANPWKISYVNDIKQGPTGYQFQPYNASSQLQNTYMNWTGGVGTNKQIGFHNTAPSGANGDSGSGWILISVPTSGTYYLKSNQKLYLNLKDLGQEGNRASETQLATLTSAPYQVTVTVNPDATWKISGTGDESANYLGQSTTVQNRPWNSWVSNDKNDFSWIVEPSLVGNEMYYKLRQTAYTSSNYTTGKFLGNDTQGNATSLYIDCVPANSFTFKMYEPSAVQFVDITYSFAYSGSSTSIPSQTVRGIMVGDTYPAPTVPFGTTGSTPTGTVPATNYNKTITLNDNLPFARIADVNDIVRWYYIRMNSDSPRYIRYVEGATSPVTSSTEDNKLDLNDLESMSWAFVGNPIDGFKLVNKKGKQLVFNGTGDATVGDEGTVLAYYPSSAVSDNAHFCLKHSGTGNYLNVGSGTVTSHSQADAGSTFMLEDAIPVRLSTAENKYYYAIKSGRNDNAKEWWYTYENTTKGNVQDNYITLGEFTYSDTQLWYFMAFQNTETNVTYVRMYSKQNETEPMSHPSGQADGKNSVRAKAVGTSGFASEWKFVANNSLANRNQYLLRTGGGASYLSNNGGVGNAMGLYRYSSTTDGGSQMYIYEVYNVDLTDEADNQYSGQAIHAIGNPVEEIPMRGVVGANITNATLSGSTLTGTIVFPFHVSKVDGVTNPTMIGLFNTKWHAVDATNIKAQNSVPTSSDIATWLWAVYPSFTDNSFSFQFKNIAYNKYIYTESTSESLNVAGTVTLNESPTTFELLTNGTYRGFHVKGGNVYLSINSNTDADVYLGTYPSPHGGTSVLYPTPSYTLSVSDAAAATLYTPIAVNIPVGITAKYVSGQAGDKLTYVTLEDVIPANTAVVLLGNQGPYTFNAATSAGAVISGNALFGYATETAVTGSGHESTGEAGTVYALGKTGDIVAFLHYAPTASPAKYAAGKAYLQATSANARFFTIFDTDDDPTTAITSVEAAENDAVIYDLSGRRVKKTQKGLYVVNGKVIVK